MNRKRKSESESEREPVRLGRVNLDWLRRPSGISLFTVERQLFHPADHYGDQVSFGARHDGCIVLLAGSSSDSKPDQLKLFVGSDMTR